MIECNYNYHYQQLELIRSNLSASSSSSSSMNPSSSTSTATSAYTSAFSSVSNSVNITRASSPRALRMPKKYPKSPVGSIPLKDSIYISPRGECESKNSDPRSFEGFGRALLPNANMGGDNPIYKREKPLLNGLECPPQTIPTRLYSDVLDMLNLTSIDSCVDTLISTQSEDSRRHWDDLQRKKDKITDLAQKKGRKVEHRVATRLSNLRKELSLNMNNIPQLGSGTGAGLGQGNEQLPLSYSNAFRLPYMESLVVAAVDSPRIPPAPGISPRIPGPGSTFETPSPGLRSTVPSPAFPSPRDTTPSQCSDNNNKVDSSMKKRPSWHVEDLPPTGPATCLFIPVESPKSSDGSGGDNGQNKGLNSEWGCASLENTSINNNNNSNGNNNNNNSNNNSNADTPGDTNGNLITLAANANNNTTSNTNTNTSIYHTVKRRKMNETATATVYPFFGKSLPAMPKGVVLRVMEFLENRDVYSTSCLSSTWSKNAMDDVMWE